MKLEEFGLDAPDAPRPERHAFCLRTRCTAALYERCFPGLKANGWKIIVECVSVARQELVKVAGVYMVQIAFDHARFAGEPVLAQKEMALAALHSGSVRVCESEGWPTTAFDVAKDGVIEHAYVNTWTWPKRPAWNRRRSHAALLRCDHGAERFTASLTVHDRDGVHHHATSAIDTDPSEFLFVPYMGSVRWTSDTRVALFDRRGTEVTSLDVATTST